MKNKRLFLYVVFLLVLVSNRFGYAQTIMYVPFDDRPVSLSYVTETVEKGGFEIIVPPTEYLANRTTNANPERLWEWVFAHANEADSIVVSADAMIYGGLVASRTHEESETLLLSRTKNFEKLKNINGAARIYVFSTIMRSPHASSGGVEPLYYEQYGPAIFRIHALQDKQEVQGLQRVEEQELRNLTATVPKEFLADWRARREKNFKVNVALIQQAQKDRFAYLLLGRDDASPYSRSHQESRWISKETVGLPASRYLSFPGADQLGMVLLARAANDLRVEIPSVAIRYTDGVGENTVASYEDAKTGKNVYEHLVAAGCVPLLSTDVAELVLAVHTPADGWTREAGGANNPSKPNQETITFVKQLQSYLQTYKKVAVADIAFANGSDNSLLAEMNRHKIIPQLESYSGWNTASNTIGYTIGQAVFAKHMKENDRKYLLTVRLLDDWAYQANIRQTLQKEILAPYAHSDVALNDITPRLIAETEKQMNGFAKQNIDWFPLRKIEITYPWNRMFEVEIKVQ